MNVFSATTQRLPLQAERDAVGRARRPSRLLVMDVRRAVPDAVAVPDDSVMLTFVIDASEGVYVHTYICPEHLFTVKPGWRCMYDIFGADSVIHGVAYKAKDDTGGCGLHNESLLQRHVRLCDLLLISSMIWLFCLFQV